MFTKLDLCNAYHLVCIKRSDEWKRDFCTPSGHSEYHVMPFGLSNSPSVFQVLVNNVLTEFINRFVFVYMDDVLVFSTSVADHQRQARQVLQKLLQNQLFVKQEKCEFHVVRTTFKEFVVSPDGVAMDSTRVQVVKDWPVPTTHKHVRHSLGCENLSDDLSETLVLLQPSSLP